MISIITPCFNSSKFIGTLASSLDNQSNKKFEWIIVDDCSNEDDYQKTMQILKNISISFKAFRMDKNSGAGKSRNYGILKSSGDYIVFVDADDYVSFDFVEVITNEVISNPEMVAFDFYFVKNGKKSKRKILSGVSERRQIINSDEAFLRIKSGVCGKVYKRELVIKNNVAFPSLKRFEDWVFVSKYLSKINQINYIDRAMYYYVSNSSSIVNTIKTSFNYSLQAFNMIKNDISIFPKSIVDSIFLREVVYVYCKESASKMSKRLFYDGLYEMGYNKLEWNKKLLASFAFHQKLVLFFVKYKLFIFVKVISKSFG